DLKRENLALLGALEEHQNTLQMVMTKYRQHVLALTKNREVEQACAQQLNSSQDTHRLADKISEMAGVMRLAADIDENNSNCVEEQLTRLRTENGVLREMLQIANSCGSVKGESLQNGFATIRKNENCSKTPAPAPSSAGDDLPTTTATAAPSGTTKSIDSENGDVTPGGSPTKIAAKKDQ
ncbi:FGFR1 oncogene partner 2-like, partial [Tropilaelaps mercedesae]